MRNLFLFTILLVFVSDIWGQNTINRGIELFNAQETTKALSVFNNILAKNSSNIEVNYYVGLIHYLDENYDKAIEYLRIAAAKNFRASKTHLGYLDDSKFLLADAYFITYRFDLAVEQLEEMQANIERHPFEASFVVETSLEKARIGQRLFRGYNPNEIVFIDSAVIAFNDILKYYPQNSNMGYLSETGFDSTDSSAFEFLSGKRDMKIFAKFDTVSRLDLYRSNRYLSGWSEEKPLTGSINTADDENYPFLLPDGITLYFASNNRRESLGGYDIFVSNTNSVGDFLKPRNAGMPFNSPYNDYMLVIDERQNIGYFVSDRYQPKGKVAIYTFEYNTRNRLSDTVANEEEKRLSALRIVIDSLRRSRIAATDLSTKSGQESDAEFRFVVADGIIYHRYGDFSREAAELKFRELQALKKGIDQLEQYLNSYRNRFVQSTNDNDRQNLGSTIKEQELRLKELKARESAMTKEIRQLELGDRQ